MEEWEPDGICDLRAIWDSLSCYLRCATLQAAQKRLDQDIEEQVQNYTEALIELSASENIDKQQGARSAGRMQIIPTFHVDNCFW